MDLELGISLLTSIGVIVSVIFLAIEIKKNTEAVRSNFYDSFANSNREFLNQLIVDKELGKLFEKGTKSWNNLGEDDKRTSNYLYIQMFRIWENLFYQNKMEVLEPWLWNSNKNTIISYFHLNGIQEWWKFRRQSFSREFVDFLEKSEKPENEIKVIEDLQKTFKDK
ncbi:hypothetical protein [Algoriphagus zhangzhouensis]|uniref:DUF4760 domain-containing protein n=1 Tax=Algoriphagus zhangzhouensis TaxID=1073327 RepID=A0A1M7ZCM1_9BACT|nr:hypothetical protein [Algoriphagus zhangzhouensis]TDY45610.1 hypothetical protein A8938_2210 [Algoriphagus zhangzhouensis]SHO62634.1 hypothetical protein SAMN04488108_2208 [Algoriphagus zhangzhouensis]